jgi:crossover junction endodeoxyribonuclease RuvC
MRVFAIDPALRNTGYGVVESDGRRHRVIAFGVIHNPAARRHSECLVHIHDAVAELLTQHNPDVCAIEGVIYVQSHRTAIALGAARGAAILATTRFGVPVLEYAPRRVKQAVVGKGAAQKEQVAFMVRALLGMTETPQADAADALAIALAHIQASQSPQVTARPSERL